MDRSGWEAPRESLPHKTRSTEVPTEDAARARNKKSPAHPTVRAIADAWAESARWPNHKIVGREVAASLGHLSPSQLTPLLVGALLAQWKKRYSHSTYFHRANKLSILLRHLEAGGAPHIALPRITRPSARAVTATPEELAKLLASPAPWLRLFILLYLQCGLRRSEALSVTPRRWNRDNHTVTVRIKGGATRTAQVTPEVEQLFAAAGPNPDLETPFLWLLKGKKISNSGITTAWVQHLRACKVNPQINAHDLRRTAATILYTATKDLRVPQQLLGHKSLASTLEYLAPLAPDEARRYAELLRFDRFHTEVKQ